MTPLLGSALAPRGLTSHTLIIVAVLFGLFELFLAHCFSGHQPLQTPLKPAWMSAVGFRTMLDSAQQS